MGPFERRALSDFGWKWTPHFDFVIRTQNIIVSDSTEDCAQAQFLTVPHLHRFSCTPSGAVDGYVRSLRFCTWCAYACVLCSFTLVDLDLSRSTHFTKVLSLVAGVAVAPYP